MGRAAGSIRTALPILAFLSATAFAETASIDPDGPFEERLSAYCFFLDSDPTKPNDRVLRYELNTPHFADHSPLDRFLFLPPGEAVRWSTSQGLRYPVGAVLILNVGAPEPPGFSPVRSRTIETRLMVRSSSGWRFAIYVWDEAAGDATRVLAGDEVPIEYSGEDGTTETRVHHVPNVNQCKMCHDVGGEIIPLGPTEVRNLNRRLEVYDESLNQLEYWSRKGWIEGLPEDVDALGAFPVWDDPSRGTLDERARAYLDVNCSSCHRPGGLADTSGLDLRFDQRRPSKFGVFKAPVAAGRGVGNSRFGIVPGSPDESILFHRLASVDPGVRMPVVGRSVVHEAGLDLIREWIEAMDYPDLVQARMAQEARVEERLRILRGREGVSGEGGE